MWVMLEGNAYKEMLMLEGKLAFVQNRAHGTNSRYKQTTTNHHVKLATDSFPSNINMCAML